MDSRGANAPSPYTPYREIQMLTLRRNTTEYSYAVAAVSALVADGWVLAYAEDAEGNLLEGESNLSIDAAVKYCGETEMGWICLTKGINRDADYSATTDGHKVVTLSLVFQGSNDDPECVIADYSATTDATLAAVSAVLDKLTDSLDLPL